MAKKNVSGSNATPEKEKRVTNPKRVSKETKEKIHQLIDEVINKPAEKFGDEVKQIREAVETLGAVSLTSNLEEVFDTARKIKAINFLKIKYVVNPTNSLVTLGNGFTIRPYTIVFLPKVFTDSKQLDLLRRSPKFINAIRNGILFGFEGIDDEELVKLYKALKGKSKNILEEAERLGIEDSANLKQLIKRDPAVEKYFEKMMEKIRKETNTLDNRINVPSSSGKVI